MKVLALFVYKSIHSNANLKYQAIDTEGRMP